MTKEPGRVGSSFEAHLTDQGALKETNAVAVKRVLAWQLEQAMERRQMSKSAMARAMRTSRSQLDRILDPENDRVQLDTLAAAADAVGLKLQTDSSEWREFGDRTADQPGIGPARRVEMKPRCADCWGPVVELHDTDGSWMSLECQVCGRAVGTVEAVRESERMHREAEDNIPRARVGRGAVYCGSSRFVLKILPDMDRDKSAFDQRVAASRAAEPRPGYLGRRDFPKGTPGYLFAQASAIVAGLNRLPREMAVISLSDFDFGEPQIVGVEGPTTEAPVRIRATIPVEHRKPSSIAIMERMGTTMAAGMLAAFACELGMKAISMTRLDEVRRTHDLLRLFDNLPEDSRDRIQADFAGIGDVLKHHRHTFDKWRYFEHNVAEAAMTALVDTDRVSGLGKAARVLIDECVVAGLQYDINVDTTLEFTAGADSLSQTDQIGLSLTGHENAIPWDSVLASEQDGGGQES